MEEARGADRVPLPEPEPIGEDCPEYGRALVKKRGRFGEFIACTGYPECRYTRPAGWRVSWIRSRIHSMMS